MPNQAANQEQTFLMDLLKLTLIMIQILWQGHGNAHWCELKLEIAC
ncbi:hypothetical protein [Nostoc sp.]